MVLYLMLRLVFLQRVNVTPLSLFFIAVDEKSVIKLIVIFVHNLSIFLLLTLKIVLYLIYLNMNLFVFILLALKLTLNMRLITW